MQCGLPTGKPHYDYTGSETADHTLEIVIIRQIG